MESVNENKDLGPQTELINRKLVNDCAICKGLGPPMASFEYANELSSDNNYGNEDYNRREKQDTVIGKVGTDGSKKNNKDNAEKGVADDNRESLNDCDICKDLGPLMSVHFGYTNESSDDDFYDDEEYYSRMKRGADGEEEDSDEKNDNDGKDNDETADEEKNKDTKDNDRKDDKGENDENTEDINPFKGHHENPSHPRPRHPRHPRHHHPRHRHHHRRIPGLSYVKLPSGKSAYINKNGQMMRSWRCGDETVLLDLDPSNREYELMANEMQSTIQKHSSLQFSEYDIKKVQRVVNGCLMKRYIKRRDVIESEYYYNERLLFHGTHQADSIIQKGFDERYASMDGMFGAGTYFAEHSSKSNQYAFGYKGECTLHKNRHCMICERKILICRVALGKIYKVRHARQKIAHPPPEFHSLQGVASNTPKGLKYNEYIVYRGEQAYPEYVVTYTLKP